MAASVFTIEHQDETLSFSKFKEALVGFIKLDDLSGLLFIKIETEEFSFSDDQVTAFEAADEYPLLYTFNFAVATLDGLQVQIGSIKQLIGTSIEFESSEAVLYIRTHLRISDNRIMIEHNGSNYFLTWTGIINDINYYDERAKPNSILIRTPISIKQYDSVDEYYELEYRSKK